MRYFTIYQAPINLILIIIIPCVDYTIDVHGWNKLLNTLQVVCMPLAVMLMKKCKSIYLFENS